MKRVQMGRVQAGELQIGVPLPFTAYDERYNLLLREGAMLGNQRQLDALLARGLYRVQSVAADGGPLPDDAGPLTRFDQVCRELNRLLTAGETSAAEFGAGILGIAARLGNLCEHHAEACLAAVLHDVSTRYAVRHMVHAAIVCSLLARLSQMSDSDRLSLLAAALTMNLSIIELQNAHSADGDRELSVAEREQIRRHPEQTVLILRDLGVLDPNWLDIVVQHHEAFDGSGYPRGLRGEESLPGARMLGLVDAYTARLRQRPDRDARLPNESLRDIFVGRGSHFDPQLAQLLVRAVGIFPPGLVVELENGEIGVVTRLGELAHAPEVQVLVSAQANLLRSPQRRRTDAAPWRIRHAMAPGSGRFRFDPLQFWS